MDEEFYRRQRELMTRVVAENDVVIATAAVPGKKAPVLIPADAVRGMQPGSVIVDLAAERGGNCELTRPGETIEAHGVTILGPTNLPAEVPYHASQMFAKNVTTFLQHLVKEGQFHFDTNDPITRETMITRGGNVVHPAIRELLGMTGEAGVRDGMTLREHFHRRNELRKRALGVAEQERALRDRRTAHSRSARSRGSCCA